MPTTMTIVAVALCLVVLVVDFASRWRRPRFYATHRPAVSVTVFLVCVVIVLIVNVID